MRDGGNWMTARRRPWTAEQRLRILQEGRQAGATVAEVCRRHGMAWHVLCLGRKSAPGCAGAPTARGDYRRGS